ncbi:MBL fold metallo-hydrolase [beta proteobacterium AAP99]|nr:MBL fold metallo-hydrolase [beta proteobacterium AAP99]
MSSSKVSNRRDFLRVGGAAATAVAGASLAPLAWAQTAPAPAPAPAPAAAPAPAPAPNFGTPNLPAPGFRRMKLGSAEIIALNCGVARRPLAEGFVRNAPLADVQAALKAANLPTEFVDIGFTAFLVVDGKRRILMDTGNGQFGAPTTGRMLANLEAAGFKADDIDTVVITHFHGDHINGLRNRDGSLVFAKAKVWVPEMEWAHWMDDAKMNAVPEAQRGGFNNSRRVFNNYPAAQLERFKPGHDFGAGVKAIEAYGHTPGHTLFEVTQGRDKFLYVGDLSNVPELFVRNPDWAVQFDMDAEAARVTRRRVLDRAAADKVMVGGYHFPFPAFGRIEKMGNGFDFKVV